jgi:hypothetical protein
LSLSLQGLFESSCSSPAPLLVGTTLNSPQHHNSHQTPFRPTRTHGMNALLLERSSSNLGPVEFARIQTTWLLRSFSAAPHLRFDGGERAGSGSNTSIAGNSQDINDASRVSLWAHQADVSALALERFDGCLPKRTLAPSTA